MTAQLVTDALVMAIWRRGKPDALLHHSDRGSQYSSEQFQRLMADHGVVCSMSRSGNVWDNAAIESFFSSLKTERTARKLYRTRDEARADVFDYIERFYNPKRRHSTIGYMSPMEFERQAGLFRRVSTEPGAGHPFAGRYAAPANGKVQMAAVHRPPAADCGDLFDGDGACGRRALSSRGGDGAERTCQCALETLGGGTVLDPRELKDEGLHLIWPWNELFMYDLRLQSITETYNAISSDGVSLTASVNAGARVQRDGVAILHKAIGPNFLQLIAQPEMGSLTREVIAHYTAEQVYSTARQEIQDKIRQRTLEKASEKRMRARRPVDLFILYDTLLYGIELPPFVVNAINRKTEQYYIRKSTRFAWSARKENPSARGSRPRGYALFSRSSAKGFRIPICNGAASTRRCNLRSPQIRRS